MRIEYEGHACLRCVSDSGEVLVMDPPAEKYGYVLTDRQANYVTTSHEHEDHNATYLFLDATLIPQVSAQMQAGPFSISEKDCFHDEERGALRGGNRIYKITADGCTLVHMGDIGHPLSKELIEFARGADVLALPVGGCFTVEPAQAVEMVHQLAPRYVLPIHYGTPQCNLKQLKPLKAFLALWKGDVHKADQTHFTPGEKGRKHKEPLAVVLDWTSAEKAKEKVEKSSREASRR